MWRRFCDAGRRAFFFSKRVSVGDCSEFTTPELAPVARAILLPCWQEPQIRSERCFGSTRIASSTRLWRAWDSLVYGVNLSCRWMDLVGSEKQHQPWQKVVIGIQPFARQATRNNGPFEYFRRWWLPIGAAGSVNTRGEFFSRFFTSDVGVVD